MYILSQAFFSDLCWRQTITSFPRQLQSERFLPHPILNPPNLLREKLILFLALHSLCAPKLSQTPVCFPSSVEWGWGITVELTLGGWPASKALFKKKKKKKANKVNVIINSDTLLPIGIIYYLHQLYKRYSSLLPSSIFVLAPVLLICYCMWLFHYHSLNAHFSQ